MNDIYLPLLSQQPFVYVKKKAVKINKNVEINKYEERLRVPRQQSAPIV